MLAECVSAVPCYDSLLLSPLGSLFRLLKPVNWLVIWIFLIHGVRSDELQKLTNTTYLLDTLLSEDKYDRKIRPGLGGPPLEIYTNVEIRSFGPISESEMVYSMDCYFRQSWSDTRLRFRSHLEKLSMDWKFLQKVWIPDTVFLNGKSSYLHKVTVPNKFIRLGKDGKLSYSMRLTVKASCPMHLRKYPLDTQACPLEIGSFAYTSEDVIYRWSEGSKVILSKDVVLSQYDFVNMTTTHRFNSRKSGDQTDQRSVLVVYFIIQRRRGYFILQIYAPCAMIVGASWVSFWINRSDAAGRVAVGATTVLTMVTMGFGGKREKVPSATAIDWFVIMCFTFVFSALVEYAFVNFIDNYEKLQAKKQMEAEREKMKQEGLEGDKGDNIRSERLRKLRTHIRETYARKKREDALLKRKQEQLRKMREQESQRLRHERRTQRNEERFGKRPQGELPADGLQQRDFLDGHPPVRKKRPAARPQTKEEKRKEEEHIRKMQKELQKLVEASGIRFGKQAQTFEGRMSIGKKTYRNRHIASKVDSYARIVFPVTFGVLNIMYWSLYLLILDDEISLPLDAGTYDL